MPALKLGLLTIGTALCLALSTSLAAQSLNVHQHNAVVVAQADLSDGAAQECSDTMDPVVLRINAKAADVLFNRSGFRTLTRPTVRVRRGSKLENTTEQKTGRPIFSKAYTEFDYNKHPKNYLRFDIAGCLSDTGFALRDAKLDLNIFVDGYVLTLKESFASLVQDHDAGFIARHSQLLLKTGPSPENLRLWRVTRKEKHIIDQLPDDLAGLPKRGLLAIVSSHFPWEFASADTGRRPLAGDLSFRFDMLILDGRAKASN